MIILFNCFCWQENAQTNEAINCLNLVGWKNQFHAIGKISDANLQT